MPGPGSYPHWFCRGCPALFVSRTLHSALSRSAICTGQDRVLIWMRITTGARI